MVGSRGHYKRDWCNVSITRQRRHQKEAGLLVVQTAPVSWRLIPARRSGPILGFQEARQVAHALAGGGKQWAAGWPALSLVEVNIGRPILWRGEAAPLCGTEGPAKSGLPRAQFHRARLRVPEPGATRWSFWCDSLLSAAADRNPGGGPPGFGLAAKDGAPNAFRLVGRHQREGGPPASGRRNAHLETFSTSCVQRRRCLTRRCRRRPKPGRARPPGR
jgi:hypothetical protein